MEHIYIEGTLYFLGACVTARFIDEVDSNSFIAGNHRLLDHTAILLWPIFTVFGVIATIYYYYSEDY
jgi:hypothetical protein